MKITTKKLSELVLKIEYIIIEELPELEHMKFDSHGFPAINGGSCASRISLGLYIELSKAGVIIE